MTRPDLRRGDRSATRIRTVRVSDDVWVPALAKAAANGETVAQVIRAALIDYVGLLNVTGVIGRADRNSDRKVDC